MSQSRRGSLIEALISTATGFAVSMVLQHFTMRALGRPTSAAEDLAVVSIFTVASIVRGYVLRRVFNRWTRREVQCDPTPSCSCSSPRSQQTA